MSSGVTYEEVLRTAQSLNKVERVRLVEEFDGLTDLPVEAEPLDDLWLAELDRRSRTGCRHDPVDFVGRGLLQSEKYFHRPRAGGSHDWPARRPGDADLCFRVCCCRCDFAGTAGHTCRCMECF